MILGRKQPTCAMVLVVLGCVITWWTPTVALADQALHDQTLLVDGNTEFALGLYSELRKTDGNLFLSPYGLSTALAMTYAGARGETARQMSAALHFSLEQEQLHPAFAELLSSNVAAADESSCRLSVANALWGQEGYEFLDGFLALAKRHYGAGLSEVDFETEAEQARKTINRWVENETQQMIKELLQESDLQADDVLVLTNAVFFKGAWSNRFDPRLTRDDHFHVGANQRVVAPMMQQSGRFRFASADHLEILEMPYQGDRLAMVLLLPKEIDGLAAVEESLSNDNLDRWLGGLREERINVVMPRLRLDARFELSETLKSMGMIDAFGSNADFSGMTGRRGLFISQVVHQARLEVNEEGTEAAAATAVKLKGGADPVNFRVDHPFVFVIRDRLSGSILFMGRVVDPTEHKNADRRSSIIQ